MIPELQELYYYETDQERLDFDSDPVYQEKMRRALAELETEDLSPALFSLLDTANPVGAGLCAGPGQSLSLRGPRSGPWQSALPALRIPTAPSGPRNDGTR